MQDIDVTALRAFVAKHAAAAAPGAGPLLLDVREPWEVALGQIVLPGAENLYWPMQSIPARLAELDPTRPVVCICHHGMRSAQVVAFLERQGHHSAYNLVGGTDAWSSLVDPGLTRY
jgi:rhodanese-related sulfurtransferase